MNERGRADFEDILAATVRSLSETTTLRCSIELDYQTQAVLARRWSLKWGSMRNGAGTTKEGKERRVERFSFGATGALT